MAVESNLFGEKRPSRDLVVKDVKQIVGEQMGIAPDIIQETDELINDLGCDSLDVTEIAMEVEDHFAISVPDDLAEQARTIAEIADGVLQLFARHRPD